MTEHPLNLRLSQTEELLVARLIIGPMLAKDGEKLLPSPEGLRVYIDRLRRKQWPIFSYTLRKPANWAGSGVFELDLNREPQRVRGRPKPLSPRLSVAFEEDCLAAKEHFDNVTPMDAKMLAYRALRYLVDLHTMADAG